MFNLLSNKGKNFKFNIDYRKIIKNSMLDNIGMGNKFMMIFLKKGKN